MAKTLPSAFFGAGYTLASSVAGFNTNTAGSNKLLTELTDTEASASEGSAEEVIFALMEMLRIKAAATALSGVTVRSQDIASVPGTVRRVYTIAVDASVGTLAVAVGS